MTAPPDPAARALDAEALELAVRLLGVELPRSAFEGLEAHAALVKAANERLNLTRILSPRGMAIEHAADSLACLLVLDEAPRTLRVVDVGSGAGYPGIPLALARPAWRITLVEARAKKARFLEEAAKELGLANVRVVCARAEDAARTTGTREAFSAAVARAVAPLPVLVELLVPLVAMGGVIVAQKGAQLGDEPVGGAAAATILGAELVETVVYELPGLAPRRLVVFRKTGSTPEAYPRRPGMPAKRPLGDGRNESSP